MVSTFFLPGWINGLIMDFEVPSDRILFSFVNKDECQRWRPVNDRVMGGVSVSRIDPAPDEGLIFSGEVSLENNGGFASIRSTGPVFDLRGFQGMVLRVRGDGKRYKVTLNSSDYWLHPGFNAPFETMAGEWLEIRIPFSGFAPTLAGGHWPGILDTTHITTVGLLIANKKAEQFRLEVDWIGAYK